MVSKEKSYKIYLIHCKFLDLYKIGLSVDYKKRLKQLKTGNPYDLTIVFTFSSKYPFKTEKTLHNLFSHKKTSKNFEHDFDYIGGEWFNLNDEDVIGFNEKCKKIEENIDILKNSENPFV